jgi:hypothetical protein
MAHYGGIMKEIEINSWNEFREIVEPHLYREWLYRGQSDSEQKLESSLYRIMNRNIELRSFGKSKKIILRKEQYEKEIINTFIKSSHLYLPAVPEKDNILDWLSVMQHYGAPTRLIDFSFSPYIALFFATSSMKKKSAVYCIKYSEIKNIDEESFPNIKEKYNKIMEPSHPLKDTLLMPYEPNFANGRLLAQQGAFLIPNTLKYSHNEILENYENDDFVYKIVIDESCAFELIENLAKINISYSNLYLGLEGFCKSFETVCIIPINRFRPINKENNI